MLENSVEIIQGRRPRRLYSTFSKVHPAIISPSLFQMLPLRPVQNSPCVSCKSLRFFQVWKWEFSFEVYVPLECLGSAGGFPALFCQKQTHNLDQPSARHLCRSRGQVSFWMEHSFQCSSIKAQLCTGVAAGVCWRREPLPWLRNWATAGRVTVVPGSSLCRAAFKCKISC